MRCDDVQIIKKKPEKNNHLRNNDVSEKENIILKNANYVFIREMPLFSNRI